MNIITENGFAVRIPEIPSRYRANCSRELGCFVCGETKGKSSRQIEKEGLIKGNFVEMALCWVDKKVLTFEPTQMDDSNYAQVKTKQSRVSTIISSHSPHPPSCCGLPVWFKK